MRQCGASVEQIDAAHGDLNRVSDAFLVYFDKTKSNCDNPEFTAGTGTAPTHALNRIQLFEYLKNPELGTFITPILVIDGNLIIGISAKSPTGNEQGAAKHLQIELANQFENKGYGAFVDFLGDLRPLVMESVPTQQDRQVFFENLIDRIPLLEPEANEAEKCCLRVENPSCSAECAFNLVCHGQAERVRQHVLRQIGDCKNKLRIS